MAGKSGQLQPASTQPQYIEQIWEAVLSHRTQLNGYEALKQLPTEQQVTLFGCQSFYRVFSLVNGGHEIEDDLFAGLR